ncbi:MAG: glycosyltransferase family 4 protein [Myxococcaceae bacterium]
MRIAQVAPVYESVPPLLYGGTERVVAYLTEELVSLGHEVTLFASGDSHTRARLVACRPRATRLDPECRDPLAYNMILLERVFERAREFDVIHFHVDYLHFPLSRRLRIRQVSTLHGRLDLPDLQPLYREYDDMPLVSISDAQRAPLPFARWMGTVHHGLPRTLLPYSPGPGKNLVFIGRVSPEKRIDRAIDIAIRLGIPLKIAAKIAREDVEYFQTIKPLLRHPLVEFVGEVGEYEKGQLLGDALALVMPVDWPEPFGLVMIESLACGTPVLAYRAGSVPELIEDGVTGFVVDDLAGAVAAGAKLPSLSRRRCREEFERRFTSDRMARDYVSVYDALGEQPLSSLAW